MKASAALCPPPIMAIFIGLPLLQGCLAMCSRYWLWWNTRPSPLSARNTCGIRGGAAGTDHQGAGGAHQLLAVGIARDHPQRLDLAGAQHRLDAQDLFAVAALLLEVAGDPAQVVVELHPAGIEGAQVDEVDQAIVLVQVVDEGIRAGGVAQGHQVLEEGDLQLALRHQGVAVPAVVALLVQEQHFQGALRLGPFLEGNRQRDIGRAEADTDEIVNHGGCSCLSHFQFLWIGPFQAGAISREQPWRAIC